MESENDFSDIDSDWEDELDLTSYWLLNDVESEESSESDRENHEKRDRMNDDGDDSDQPLLEALEQLERENNGWLRRKQEVPRKEPTIRFDETSCGINPEIEKNKLRKPFDVFRLFLSSEFMKSLLQNVNFRSSTREKGKHSKAHRANWSPFTMADLYNFIGLSMLMGILVKPCLHDYWAKVEYLLTPIFPKFFTRDKFVMLMRCLNTCGETAKPTTRDARPQPSTKVSWLFNHLNSISKWLYSPRQELTIDESMIKHKGFLSFKQYLPAKPTKWGIKCWVLAESATGYIMRTTPYFGRQERGKQSLAEYVTFNLLKNCHLLGKAHIVFMDNYYTTVSLFKKLLQYSTYACGTVRLKRAGMPKRLMKKKNKCLKETGNTVFQHKDSLLFTAWKVKRLVCVLSSYYGSEMSTVKRILKDKKSGKFAKSPVPCPQAFRDYCQFMKGVDRGDQMLQYYKYERKSRRWPVKIFWYVIEVMKLNSYIVFNSLKSKKMSLREFSLEIIAALLRCPVSVQRPIQTTELSRLTSRCFPYNLGKRSFCKVCYARVSKGKQTTRRQTFFGWKTCSVHLCIPDCFRVYNTVKDFINAEPEE